MTKKNKKIAAALKKISTTPTTKAKTKRPIQKQLPAMADKKDPVLSRLGLQLRETRDERKQLHQKEKEIEGALCIAMKQRGVTVYRDREADILVVFKERTEKLDVKTVHEASEARKRKEKKGAAEPTVPVEVEVKPEPVSEIPPVPPSSNGVHGEADAAGEPPF